jgi:uncharacterized membrane protein
MSRARRVFRHVQARPRLMAATLLGLALVMALPTSLVPRWPTRALLGWNLGAVVYLLLVARMMLGADAKSIGRRALAEDEGRHAVLAVVIVASLACLGAIVAQLADAKGLQGAARYGHVALAAATVLTAWSFIHTIFALHYAHDYYLARVRGLGEGGLSFPGTPEPDYLDFLYFAFVIGTSGQTADVGFTTSAMRRTGLLHCVLAFVFNTTLLALTINMAAGLF